MSTLAQGEEISDVPDSGQSPVYEIEQATTIAPHPSYYETLPNSQLRQIFLPELLEEIAFYMEGGDYRKPRMKVNTLYSCCLVCRQWMRVFTQFLYEDIVLNDSITIPPASLLRRTLGHVQPARRGLIKRVTIVSSPYSTPSAWIVILSQLPNLKQLAVFRFDQSRCHPKFPQHLQLLSSRCAIVLESTLIRPSSIAQWVRFLQRSQPDMLMGMMQSEISKSKDSLDVYCSTESYVGRCRVKMGYSLCTAATFRSMNVCLAAMGCYVRKLRICLNKCTIPILDINLRYNTHLHLLLLLCGSRSVGLTVSPRLMAQWFQSICSTITSESLEIQLLDFPADPIVCRRMEDALLDLKSGGRVSALRVYLDRECTDREGLFPRLYQTDAWTDERQPF